MFCTDTCSPAQFVQLIRLQHGLCTLQSQAFIEQDVIHPLGVPFCYPWPVRAHSSLGHGLRLVKFKEVVLSRHICYGEGWSLEDMQSLGALSFPSVKEAYMIDLIKMCGNSPRCDPLLGLCLLGK